MPTSKRAALTAPVLLALLGGLAGLSAPKSALAGGVYGAHTGHGEYGYECQHCRLAALRFRGALDESDPAIKIDATTGRDLRNYAPDRLVDYKHMRLRIDIPDMNSRTLNGAQMLAIEPIADDLSVLTLDAVDMAIQGVSVTMESTDGASTRATFDHDGERLQIRFDPPIPAGVRADLNIDYTLTDPTDGLFWLTEDPAWPGRPAQIHTQGQPETNRHWFPCHDSPNERMTTEIIARVPMGYTVSSNGKLLDRREMSDATSESVVYRWLLNQPHPSYLVTLVVGKFDVVDVAPKGFEIPLPCYVPPGKGPWVEQTFGNTARMIEVFEDRFDEPYPWPRYANLVVWNFGAGGMENTSASTLYDTAVLDETALNDNDLDGLNSHELAHQWFGDLITCNTWAHIWLNEGWATYSTSLWLEARDGYNDGYLRNLMGPMRDLPKRDTLEPGTTNLRPGMVSTVYNHPWEVFRRASNPYPKGAATLHMLRSYLGEEVFFKGVANYIDQRKLTTVETDQFRRVLEETSGKSLEQFFEQWTARPGTPRVTVATEWDEASQELLVTVEQNQRIDELHPAYAFDLPMEIAPEGYLGAPVTITIPIRGKSHERSIKLPARPEWVIVDPHLTVCMDVTHDQPTRQLLNMANMGHTLPSILEGIRALASRNEPGVADALEGIINDNEAHWMVRQEAATALGSLGETQRLLELTDLDAGKDSAKVRLAVFQALNSAWTEGIDELLAPAQATLAKGYPSYAVPAEAMEMLGKHGDDRALPILAKAMKMDSQHEQIRRGAVKGLAHLDHKDGLDLAIELTKFGNLNRLRPDAIDAVATLAHHDVDKALDAIGPLLRDTERRARDAARDALVKIGDPKGLELLKAHLPRERHAVSRERIEEAIERLSASLK